MSDEQLQSIEIDDDYNPVQEDIVRVISEFKANPEFDYLFKKKAPSVDTVTPNSKFVKEGGGKGIGQILLGKYNARSIAPSGS